MLMALLERIDRIAEHLGNVADDLSRLKDAVEDFVDQKPVTQSYLTCDKWRACYNAGIEDHAQWNIWAPPDAKHRDSRGAWFESEAEAEKAIEFLRVLSTAEWKIEKDEGEQNEQRGNIGVGHREDEEGS